MSRQDRENQTIDYLYDELDPQERAEFEEALQHDDALRSEVKSLKDTQEVIKRTIVEEPPQALYYDLVREARKAVSDGPKESLLQRLTSRLLSPAAATAMLAAVVVIVAISLTITDTEPGDSSAPPSGQTTVAKVDHDSDKFGKVKRDRKRASEPAPVGGERVAENRARPAEANATDIVKEKKRADGMPLARSRSGEASVLAGKLDAPPVTGFRDGAKGKPVALGTIKAKREKRVAKAERKMHKRVSSPVTSALGSTRAGYAGRSPTAKSEGIRVAKVAAKPADSGPAAKVAKRSAPVESSAPTTASAPPPKKMVVAGSKAPARVANVAGLRKERTVAVADSEAARPVRTAAKVGRGRRGGQVARGSVGNVAQRTESPSAASSSRQLDVVVVAKKAAGKGRGMLAKADLSKQRSNDFDKAMKAFRGQRYDRAITGFKRVLADNTTPNRIRAARLNLARAYRKKGYLRTAQNQYKAVLASRGKAGTRPAVLLELAKVEMRLGQYSTAIGRLSEAGQDKRYARKCGALIRQARVAMKRRTVKRQAAKEAARKRASATKSQPKKAAKKARALRKPAKPAADKSPPAKTK
jgi:predicted negative regulator of RcsB-dependent stress response